LVIRTTTLRRRVDSHEVRFYSIGFVSVKNRGDDRKAGRGQGSESIPDSRIETVNDTQSH
jgi:hypothetical protein